MATVTLILRDEDDGHVSVERFSDPPAVDAAQLSNAQLIGGTLLAIVHRCNQASSQSGELPVDLLTWALDTPTDDGRSG